MQRRAWAPEGAEGFGKRMLQASSQDSGVLKQRVQRSQRFQLVGSMSTMSFA